MSKNLVIVESPAKARTIERYLGADYRVLASYGHVRDLPENPGKGKLGVDVEHDFAPEYVIFDDRRKQVAEIEKAAQQRRPGLPRHRPRPRGRGDRLARRRGGRRPARQDAPGDLQRDHGAGDPRGVRRIRARSTMDLVDAQQARRIVDRLVGYTLSPLLSRKVRGGPVGRACPVRRGPPRRRARARDPRVPRPRVLDDRGAPRYRGRSALRTPRRSRTWPGVGRGRPPARPVPTMMISNFRRLFGATSAKWSRWFRHLFRAAGWDVQFHSPDHNCCAGLMTRAKLPRESQCNRERCPRENSSA